MNFKDKFNKYLKDLDCSSKDLADLSKISESVISRYKNGKRTPQINSSQLKQISSALTTIIKEKNITDYENINVYEDFCHSLSSKDNFNYENFNIKFNNLITTLKININEMSKYIAFDASHISRIRYGKTKPSDPISFCNKIINYITTKYNTPDDLTKLSTLIGNTINNSNIKKELHNYLIENLSTPPKNNIEDFLKHLNNFNLNDYIKAIKFDELKVPTIPFYKAKNKVYLGLENMKRGELDFFKATVLSKNKEDIFMCSDMPMEDMAQDLEFGKKWMFAIAMCLKKGHHLNIIHNLDRPFNEMLLGLESWLPIYMTGQISPYYIKKRTFNIYGHQNYVSGTYALSGECIEDHHESGKLYLTSNKEELVYYKEKANFLLKKANSLMDIYNEKDQQAFFVFLLNDTKIKDTRKRILNSLPLFTIDTKLLTNILNRNSIPKNDQKQIIEYKEKEENYIKTILKDNQIIDIIYNYDEATFNQTDKYLSLENMFYPHKIKYTFEEYQNHLKSTLNYKNKNYQVTINKTNNPFANISINILENNYVIISKISNPVIHFVIRHPKLISAINNFNPLVWENEKIE